MSKGVISEINVTPFIDVMLVLLVIFMITSPMMLPVVEVNLPSAASSVDSADEKAIVLTLSKSNNIYVSDKVVHMNDLAATILELSGRDVAANVLISADKESNYGQVIKVMDVIRGVGIVRVGLIIDDENS